MFTKWAIFGGGGGGGVGNSGLSVQDIVIFIRSRNMLATDKTAFFNLFSSHFFALIKLPVCIQGKLNLSTNSYQQACSKTSYYIETDELKYSIDKTLFN